MGPNPSFFRFIKHVMRDSSKMSYTEHLLSSSSSLKNKEVLTIHGGGGGGGGNLREVGQVFWKALWQLFVVTLEHGTCLHLVLQLGNFLSLSHTNPMSHYTPSAHPKSAPVIITLCFGLSLIESMLPSHFSCLTMFKGSFIPNQPLCSITNLHPHVSLCSFDLSSYITFLCQFHVDDGGHIMALLR
jgi:hypothetical protein